MTMFKKFAVILFLYSLCLLLPVFFLRSAHAVTDTTNLISGVDYNSPVTTNGFSCRPRRMATIWDTTWDSSKKYLNGWYGAYVNDGSHDVDRSTIKACFDWALDYTLGGNYGPFYNSNSSSPAAYVCPDKYNGSVYQNVTIQLYSSCSSSTVVSTVNGTFSLSVFAKSFQSCSDPAFPISDVDQNSNPICLSKNLQCKVTKDVLYQKWATDSLTPSDKLASLKASADAGLICRPSNHCEYTATLEFETLGDSSNHSYLFSFKGTGNSCETADTLDTINPSVGCDANGVCSSPADKPSTNDSTCYIDEDGVYYCYKPAADSLTNETIPSNCTKDSTGAIICENFDGSTPSNCINFDGKTTCYNTDGTDVPNNKLPDNCATLGGKTVCATNETGTGQTTDKDGDGKPDTKLDGTKSGTTTTGTITTTTTTTTDPTTGTTTTSTTGTVTIDTGGLNNTLTDGFSDVVDAINGLENGGGDCTENCVTDPTVGLSGGDGIYEQTDKTIESVYAAFSNRIKNAPIASVATDFFNYNPSAGACPTWTFAGVSGGMFNFPSFTFDFYCTFQHWGVIHTVIIIVFSMFAFRVAFLD